MVKLREYRIPMPMTVEEYKLAQVYMTAKTTRMELQRCAGAGKECTVFLHMRRENPGL
ncbi:hypothetical protein T484DRAFT_1778249 [Baffinella frigidus]|nr:hypothetical protein T484DRAFT_1778249 [Cryptophyta sp. CCMP2293]